MKVTRLKRATLKDQATSAKKISTKEGPPTPPVWGDVPLIVEPEMVSL